MKKILSISVVSLVLGISIQAQSIIGDWELTSIIVESDMIYSITAPITLTIEENGKFSGHGGCNDFVGLYSFKKPRKWSGKRRKISFSDVIFCRSKKVCQNDSNTEDAFFLSLRDAAKISFKNGELIIKNKASVIRSSRSNILIQNTMRFVRKTKSDKK
jgi:heat shock protein HslJ